MSEGFYKQLMNQLPMGYAYHKIICDEMGTPCDYVFVEVNEVFEELTGLKGADITGKPITKVLPEISESEFDWIALYGEIALKGSKKEFEQFSEPLNRWYRVTAYSPQKGYFITIFSDMSNARRQINELQKLTEAFQKSESRYRRLAENAKDIIYRINLVPERHFEYVSPAVSDITGYTPEEHYADPDLGMKMVHPEDYHLIEKAGRGEIPSGEPLTLRWLRKDGQVIWTEQRNNLLINEDGIPVAIEGIARDITVRKQAEEALQVSEQFIRHTLDGLLSHIVVINEGGEIILTNKAYRDFAERNNIEHSTVSEGCNYLAVCDNAQGEDSEEAGFFAQGIREVLSGKRPSFELEYPCHSPNEQRWFLGRVTPFKSDSPRRVVIAHENITERKLAEEQIERLAKIADIAPSAIVVHDFEGRFLFINERTCKLLGYEKDEFMGMNIQQVNAPESAEMVSCRMKEIEEKGETEFEAKHIRKDGSTIPSHIIARKIEWSGKPAILSIGTDITELKLAEDALIESEASLQAVLNATADGILAIGKDKKLLYSNQHFSKLWRIPSDVMEIGDDSILLKHILDQLSDPEGFLQKVQEIYSSDKEIFDAINFDDGRVFERLSRPLLIESKVIGRVWSFRDITQRKLAEESLQRFAEELEHQRKDLEKRLHQSVNAISKIGELRDVYTAGHQKRVAELAFSIGREMGLADEKISNLSYGGLLHDVGKFFVPSDILNKPGKVSDLEYKILQTHVEESYNVVKEIDFPKEIHTMVYQHHERLDGSGYPQGLSGDEIILESRILAVADVVEAMTSHRPYRAAFGIDAALKEILLHRGTKYDAEVVDICVKLFKEDGLTF